MEITRKCSSPPLPAPPSTTVPVCLSHLIEDLAVLAEKNIRLKAFGSGGRPSAGPSGGGGGGLKVSDNAPLKCNILVIS